MERDLRTTPLWEEVEAFHRQVLARGFGKITGLGSPANCPDGRWVAVAGERLDDLEGHPHGRICLATTDGSGLRPITHGPNDDTQPRWSPDGGRLTFQSDRAAPGRFQLYGLDAHGIGEATQLADVPGVVEHHRWSPDGTHILLVVAGTSAEQADALGSGTLGEDAALPPWVPEVESFEESEEWRRLWILDVATGEARVVSREGLNVWEASWCGNGSIVAVASNGPSEGDWYGSSLVAIDPSTGADRELLEAEVQLGLPEGAPDGSMVAVVRAVCSDRYIVAGDLLLVGMDGSGARVVPTPGDVTWLAWRDPTSLFAMALDVAEAVALEIDPGRATADESWRTAEAAGAFYPAGAPLADVGAFVTVVSSSERPPELISIEAGQRRVLASVAHEGHEVVRAQVGRRERVSWTAPDGLEIHGFWTVPRGEPPFATIVNVHGGPISAFADAWPGVTDALLLSRGFALFQPNPRGSGGRGQDFAGRVVADMGGADAHDILSGMQALIDRGSADPDRLAVAGGSYGGFMACWLPVLDQRFKAAVSLSPVTDWYSERFASSLGAWAEDFLGGSPAEARVAYDERSPVLAIDRVVTPTLLSAGIRDKATPRGQAIEFYRALRAQGVPTEVVVYPAEGHGVRSFPALLDLRTRTVAWLERFVPAR